VTGFIYLWVASSGTFAFRVSLFPHHIMIADAWLHGQLSVRQEVIDEAKRAYAASYRDAVERELRAQGQELTEAGWQEAQAHLTPPLLHDWSVVDGKYYGYFGPMPALLLLPYVAVAGLGASDMLFSCCLGTGTVWLIYLVIRQANRMAFVRADTAVCVALALLFGLGTVHFYCAVLGQTWFLSLIVTDFFLTLAIWCVLQSRNGLRWSVAAGAALGAAYLARPSVLATALFFYIVSLALWDSADLRWRRSIRHGLALTAPLTVAIAVGLAFNYARFGNPFESGLRIQLETGANPIFRELYHRHGIFSWHYLPTNIYYYFLNPLLQRDSDTRAITFDPWGNSMFLVTPALLYVFRAARRHDWFTTAIWLGVGTSMLTLLLFHGTGWVQFGNRYLLDLMPLAVLLVVIGMSGRLTRTAALLIGASIIVNAWGTYRFCLEQF